MKFILALTTVLTSIASGQSVTASSSVPASQMKAIASEKTARTPAQRKLDSALLYLSREAAGQPAVTGVPSLKSRVERQPDGRVVVDIAAVPSPELRAAIRAAGGIVIYESPRWSSVRASLPPSAFEVLALRTDINRIARGAKMTRHTVTNESDAAHKANTARTDFGATGAGIKVGVISDSADHYTESIASGELPAGYTVLEGRSGIPDTGEGTAMSEIVHDIAPGSPLYFATASGGKAFFADSILKLREAGCRVIVDDISYGSEWQFQDDEIGKAINQVVADGALYLSSSGNEGSLKRGTSTTWEGDFADGGAAGAPLPTGSIHRFGTQNFNRLTGGDSGGTLQWSDEYHSSANDYDLYVLSADGTTIVSASTDTQDGTQEPMEFAEGIHPGERLVVWKAPAATARYLRLATTKSHLEIATAGQTIGHAATAKCICVASSDATLAAPVFTTASLVEDSSSDGPHRMFYKPDGTPVTPGNFLASGGGISLQTPALTAGDGGATSVPGFEHFYGTSAAAPAAAAIAALVWSRSPSLTNTQVRTLLESSCLDIEAPGFEVNSGNGLLMADLALQKTLKPQDTWRKLHFGTYLAEGDAAPGADPDHEALPNLVEYATGTDPKVANLSPLTTLSRSGATFTLNYRRDPAATDAFISFEHATGLSGWQAITPSSDTLVSSTGGVELRGTSLPTGTGGRDFFRMVVTAP